MISPPGDSLDKSRQRTVTETVVEFDVDGRPAFAPLMAIVTLNIQGGDGFYELIKLLPAFLSLHFTTNIIFLER